MIELLTKLLALVEALEWSGSGGTDDYAYRYCKICGRREKDDHHEHCEFKEFIDCLNREVHP